MDFLLVLGALLALPLLAYFFGYDSRDGRKQLW